MTITTSLSWFSLDFIGFYQVLWSQRGFILYISDFQCFFYRVLPVFLPHLTWFHRVWWSSCQCYRVLLGFTGCYWVLPSFYRFLLGLLGFSGFYPSFTGFYWVFIGFLQRFSWVLPSFTGFYWVWIDLTMFDWVFTSYDRVRLSSSGFLPSFYRVSMGSYWVWFRLTTAEWSLKKEKETEDSDQSKTLWNPS